jgi:aminoglycoside 6'-N-acetyltransferase I
MAYHGNVPDICIRLVQPADCIQLARLREALWPKSSAEEHAQEVASILNGDACSTMPLVILVAETTDQTLVGFVEAGLRSHADGCNASRPVGYIEGWYVIESHRRRGIGSQLMSAAEKWARGQGCAEMASDTWIDNDVSQRVHELLGYEVVDRCVHYRKTL